MTMSVAMVMKASMMWEYFSTMTTKGNFFGHATIEKLNGKYKIGKSTQRKCRTAGPIEIVTGAKNWNERLLNINRTHIYDDLW